MVTKSVVTNKTNGLKRQQHDLGAVFNINSCVIPDSEPKMQSLTQINGQIMRSMELRNVWRG